MNSTNIKKGNVLSLNSSTARNFFFKLVVSLKTKGRIPANLFTNTSLLTL